MVAPLIPTTLMVAPFTGAWIEIPLYLLVGRLDESLPSRERGLKLITIIPILRPIMSLPSRERGLKSQIGYLDKRHASSLPSRERGLKLRRPQLPGLSPQVAPFTGAWIEIVIGHWYCLRIMSLPSRERGLKSRPQVHA